MEVQTEPAILVYARRRHVIERELKAGSPAVVDGYGAEHELSEDGWCLVECYAPI
jgi:hypothetical protein